MTTQNEVVFHQIHSTATQAITHWLTHLFQTEGLDLPRLENIFIAGTLSDGLILKELGQIIFKQEIKFNESINNAYIKRDNVNLVINFLRNMKKIFYLK